MKKGRQSKNVEDRRGETHTQVTPGEWVEGHQPFTKADQEETGKMSEHLRDKTPLIKQKKTIVDKTIDAVNTAKHPYSDLNSMRTLQEIAKPIIFIHKRKKK